MIQPPSPTGIVRVQQPRQRPAGHANTGTPLASFLLGQVQTFSIDLQQAADPGAGALPGVFRPGRLEGVEPADDQRRAALHARTFRRPRSTARRRSSTCRRSSSSTRATEPVRPLKKNNFGPRLGLVYRLTDKTIVSSGYGLVWIEMAGITTPFTTPTFPFLQTVLAALARHHHAGVRAAERAERGADRADADRGPGPGRVCGGRDLGSGYVQQWNASVQRELTSQHRLRGRLRRLEDHPRRHPRHATSIS